MFTETEVNDTLDKVRTWIDKHCVIPREDINSLNKETRSLSCGKSIVIWSACSAMAEKGLYHTIEKWGKWAEQIVSEIHELTVTTPLLALLATKEQSSESFYAEKLGTDIDKMLQLVHDVINGNTGVKYNNCSDKLYRTASIDKASKDFCFLNTILNTKYQVKDYTLPVLEYQKDILQYLASTYKGDPCATLISTGSLERAIENIKKEESSEFTE